MVSAAQLRQTGLLMVSAARQLSGSYYQEWRHPDFPALTMRVRGKTGISETKEFRVNGIVAETLDDAARMLSESQG